MHRSPGNSSCLLLVAALLLVCAQCTSSPAAELAVPRHPKVIGYLASWSVTAEGFHIADIPADQLTHINYAFGKLTAAGLAALGDACLDAGECPQGERPLWRGGNFAELASLKRKYPHLKVLISLGGWNGSQYFSDAAATPQGRERLAQSVIDVFFRKYPELFDGVDIDWEYPVEGGLGSNSSRPTDRMDATLLVEEFRRQLDALQIATSGHYELTFAVSANPDSIGNIEAARLAKTIDWFGVMTYDYHAGSSATHFNSPLFAVTGDPSPTLNVDASMRAFRSAGVPAEKLVVGVPFYGRVYSNVAADNDGLLQMATPSSNPQSPDEIDYRALMASAPAQHGFKRYWQNEAKVPWLYNSQDKTWITYDDPVSIEGKAKYVRENGFAGVMAWALTGDDRGLLSAIHRGVEGQ